MIITPRDAYKYFFDIDIIRKADRQKKIIKKEFNEDLWTNIESMEIIDDMVMARVRSRFARGFLLPCFMLIMIMLPIMYKLPATHTLLTNYMGIKVNIGLFIIIGVCALLFIIMTFIEYRWKTGYVLMLPYSYSRLDRFAKFNNHHAIVVNYGKKSPCKSYSSSYAAYIGNNLLLEYIATYYLYNLELIVEKDFKTLSKELTIKMLATAYKMYLLIIFSLFAICIFYISTICNLFIECDKSGAIFMVKVFFTLLFFTVSGFFIIELDRRRNKIIKAYYASKNGYEVLKKQVELVQANSIHKLSPIIDQGADCWYFYNTLLKIYSYRYKVVFTVFTTVSTIIFSYS